MKKDILFVFCAFFTLNAFAQLPDWVKTKPIPNPNYPYMDYIVGIGYGKNEAEAEREAYYKVLKQLIDKSGFAIRIQDVESMLKEGMSIGVIELKLNIPHINRACYHSVWYNGKYRVYLLYQVPKDGRVTSYQLNYETFTDCEKRSKYSNGASVAASIFIPGVGQMMKRHYAEGIFTLLGEAALVGGGVYSYYNCKKQLDIMRDINVEYTAFNQAKNTYNTMRIVSYSCYGAAAVLYIVNIVRAGTAKPHIKNDLSFYSTVIPSNDSEYAMGVGMNINF